MSDQPLLLGSLWDKSPKAGHFGEPTRALLFTTRDAARAWCDVQHAKYADRGDGCSKWRFRPVRVRETVKVVTKP